MVHIIAGVVSENACFAAAAVCTFEFFQRGFGRVASNRETANLDCHLAQQRVAGSSGPVIAGYPYYY